VRELPELSLPPNEGIRNMGELVLMVVAAAWAAVLIPPLLRNRIENRPNSSVTDFRRQLNKLQSTVPSRAAGPMRGYARPLAPSPLQRPAASGRPGSQAAQLVRGAGGRTHGSRSVAAAPVREAPRRRSHGDPTGGQPRPQHRQAHVARQAGQSSELVRRRRSNVLFLLVLATGATLFLAATTQEPAMLYLFALAFLALCGYAYLLAQVRQRESQSWPTDWMHR
jgi:hypothetical protein